MTDESKKKPNNVKTIRKDIVLPTEEPPKLEPIPHIVTRLEELLADVKEGKIRELAYAACDVADQTNFGILGYPINFTLMNTQLDALKTLYTESVVMPMFFGFDEEFDEQ